MLARFEFVTMHGLSAVAAFLAGFANSLDREL